MAYNGKSKDEQASVAMLVFAIGPSRTCLAIHAIPAILLYFGLR
jgi:hypothetical protein